MKTNLNPFSWLTTWCSLFFVLLVILQWFTPIGLLFIMLGAPIWVGFLPHIIASAVVIDVFAKKLPRWLVILPAAPYVIYYVFFILEFGDIKKIENDLKAQNSTEILRYDATIHSLVLSSRISRFYNAPVSYSLNSNYPEGYIARRLVTRDLAHKVKESRESIQVHNVTWYSFGSKRLLSKKMPNVAWINIPEEPTKEILAVTSQEIDSQNEKLKRVEYSFVLNGNNIGTAYSATYAKLPVFPRLTIGCVLNNSGKFAWKCLIDFVYQKRKLRVLPNESDSEKYGTWIVSHMLQIEKFTDDDLMSFENDPESVIILTALHEKKKKETSEDFDEWGIRKDSLYQPTISTRDGYPSLEGTIYAKNKGGSFYSFIRKNTGQIVYLNIQAGNNINGGRYDISNYGVCKNRKNCTTKTDDSYHFRYENGDRFGADESGRFIGFFRVGEETKFENKYNKGDNDTGIILTVKDSI